MVKKLAIHIFIIFFLVCWSWHRREFLLTVVAQSPARMVSVPFAQQVASGPSAGSPRTSESHDTWLAPLTINYPEQGSIFPPEITPPTLIWHDPAEGTTVWLIDVAFSDGSAGMQVKSHGERLRIGEIDPRCVAPTNELPKLTPEEASAWTWTPKDEDWAAIKKHSKEHPATVTITGFRDENLDQPISRGQVTIQTSKDPVGAPIFYRDVPLEPSELQKGVIKPLPKSALPLVAWQLRNVGEPRGRLLLDGLHTCANCHSFSRDGKTLGMDLDGPQNDKGLYALVSIKPQLSIRNEDVISWNSFQENPVGQMRVGFMSRVSPDGQYVMTTIDGSYYVENFKDYRFLQVFYPTRAILAYYNRATGQKKPLPGADDSRYVQTGADWSPDGKYLVFARATARDPYPEGVSLAEHANDPEETPIQYDLFRIPFNEGKGGQPDPIAGASRNGMSNNFPRISPDGRWIVFVKCHNGQLMRPDSQLCIVPAEGGVARRMRCNTPLMNSWHSFSPNGRWLVFSSKSRSPYTQMFLTHLDEEGNDSPAILIDNSTAANRAVNIPEFVNIPPDGLMKIDVPAVESYRLFDIAVDLTAAGQYDAAIEEWKKALELDPKDFRARNNLGGTLLRSGRVDEGITQFQKALETNPRYADAYDNLGIALLQEGKVDEGIVQFQKALEINPEHVQTHANLGNAFYMQGKYAEALAQWHEGLRSDPNLLALLTQSAWVLSTSPDASVRNGAEAVELAERAAQLSRGQDPAVLDTLAAAYAEAGKFAVALETVQKALARAAQQESTQSLIESLKARRALYETNTPFRDTQ
jgi:Flp pilus assembly protein TadD